MTDIDDVKEIIELAEAYSRDANNCDTGDRALLFATQACATALIAIATMMHNDRKDRTT